METDQLGQELGDQDRVLLVFDYLGPLALVSLMASRREFVKWHAKQGIVLWSALVVAYPVLHFVDYVLDRYFWSVFGQMFSAGIWLIVTGVVLVSLVCVIRALEGERFKLPMLGDLADRL
jgi:uncharacterized membrane protein